MNQDTLFDVATETEARHPGRAEPSPPEPASAPVDGVTIDVGRLDIASLAVELAETIDPLDTARVASRLRDAAEALVASAIRDAEDAGATWRQIGAHLDKPFQTLHRRYGRR